MLCTVAWTSAKSLDLTDIWEEASVHETLVANHKTKDLLSDTAKHVCEGSRLGHQPVPDKEQAAEEKVY